MRLCWQVSLSNGEVFSEDDRNSFERGEGAMSPWLQLQEYIKKNDLRITSLQIVDRFPVPRGFRVPQGAVINPRRFHLPSAGSNPKFKAFSQAGKPIDYAFGRPFTTNVNSGKTDLFCRIEAIYEKYRLQIWVSEENPDNNWVAVIER